MPVFTDANDDYFAARIHRVFDQSDRAGEIIAQPLAKPLELENFNVEDAPGFFEIIHFS